MIYYCLSVPEFGWCLPFGSRLTPFSFTSIPFPLSLFLKLTRTQLVPPSNFTSACRVIFSHLKSHGPLCWYHLIDVSLCYQHWHCTTTVHVVTGNLLSFILSFILVKLQRLCETCWVGFLLFYTLLPQPVFWHDVQARFQKPQSCDHSHSHHKPPPIPQSHTFFYHLSVSHHD